MLVIILYLGDWWPLTNLSRGIRISVLSVAIEVVHSLCVRFYPVMLFMITSQVWPASISGQESGLLCILTSCRDQDSRPNAPAYHRASLSEGELGKKEQAAQAMQRVATVPERCGDGGLCHKCPGSIPGQRQPWSKVLIKSQLLCSE